MKRKLFQVLATLVIATAALSMARGAGGTWEEMVKRYCQTDEQRRTLMRALHELEEVSKDFCKNEVLSEEISPDKQWKAVIFQRRCGVGARDTTNVSIIRASETLANEPGNAFSLEGTAVYSVVSVKWNGPHNMTIIYNRNEVVCFAARFASDTSLFHELAPKP